ncbi:MAG: SDR family NAD(P)-dependent oxidoreductase [Planctomycetota bacterium]
MSDRPVVIITGASSGIGAEVARAYAAKGFAVVLAARRLDKLNAAAAQCRATGCDDDAVVALQTDVTDHQQVDALVNRTVETFGRLDVMVNNAGYGQFGRVHELDEQAVRDIFETNFFGAFYGSQAAACVMIPQGRGHIFNVSSVIGRVGSPFHGSYSASKFALSGLTEAMRVELQPLGIHVTEVCPALTETEFSDHVRDGKLRQSSRILNRKTFMPARTVAARMVRRTGKRTPRMVFTVSGRFLIVLATIWPRAADRLLKVYHDDLAKLLPPPDKDQSS